MKNNTLTDFIDEIQFNHNGLFELHSLGKAKKPLPEITLNYKQKPAIEIAEILFITSYPPRECGIATYSHDLITVLENQFSTSFAIKVCALEAGYATNSYPNEVKYILDTTNSQQFSKLANYINQNSSIKIVVIQHEFGFFHGQEKAFLQFLEEVTKPISIVFHTVLPNPNELLKAKVQKIASECQSIIVMTNHSSDILVKDYNVKANKISVIAHGTHLIAHSNKDFLKKKYGLTNQKVLSTFGLLSSGKSIETTLNALPEIIKTSPDVVFLIIGKTHPEVVKNEGEKYREMLEATVETLGIQKHVRFINNYLATPVLLEYLQLTDIYLFTTNDPNQAVSGTFAYAMSCACPIISTPIPHAKEVLTEDTGIIFDFRNTQQLAAGVRKLLNDDTLRENISLNALQKIISSAWENSAIAHAKVFEKISNKIVKHQYNLPAINLAHLKKMTTDIGIIQFSKVNQPDLSSGYTLDDNARALIAICMHFELTADHSDLPYIQTYLDFIQRCMLPSGYFVNYIDKNLHITNQNKETNLDDANGRAIWALGYVTSLSGMLPVKIVNTAAKILDKSFQQIDKVHSTRSMAFIIKGLYYYRHTVDSPECLNLIKLFANRLAQMYEHESSEQWNWYEGYLTYANSQLPEAMLDAWLVTGEPIYKSIAIDSLDFLLSKIFNDNGIEVISNRTWLQKGAELGQFGEQPIDVAYTIMTLSRFYDVFNDEEYSSKMKTAFNWFLGENRLHQIVYNPCTGGCHDGLEETNVNLNQGAESTVSYLMARLSVEKYRITKATRKNMPVNCNSLYNKKTPIIKVLSKMAIMEDPEIEPDYPLPTEPNIPNKPDKNPDPTRIEPGVNEPTKNDPTRIGEIIPVYNII